LSERGVFAVDRGIWDHDVLSENEPFSRREAWLWIVSEAAWKPHKRRIIGRTIELTRGQYAGSLRFIASKWRWTEPRVRRFLAALISAEMLDASTDAGVTVLTVCKYDEYQRVSLPSDAIRESDLDAGATQERRKVEDREDKEVTEANASGADAPPDPAIPEREYFERGRKVLGSKSGAMIANLLKAKGRNVALARAALEEASQKQKPMEYVAAICRGPPVARATTVYQQRQAEGREILNEIDQSISRRSGAADFVALRHDPSDGRSLVRGGTGADVIDIPAKPHRFGG
jgi:hypothetical protein